MTEARTFTRLAEVGDVVAIACTPDGSLLAINDLEGRVRFYAVAERELEPLDLQLSRAAAVLLHPDGRVISYRCEDELLIRIDDPRHRSKVREFSLGPVERDEYDEDEDEDDGFAASERPSVADGFYFDVAILERRPPLEWLLPLQIANARRDAPVDWMSGLPDELLHGDIWPARFTRMALHPNRRWLAILDRGTWVVDLESGQLLSSFGHGIDAASLFEYGEGTHTIGFDDRGLLTLASVAISGNPFLQVDRFDVETGVLESTTETWRQRWGDPEGSAEFEVHVYDPTTHFPPELIPAGAYKVLFRRHGIELWSQAGLVRGIAIDARTCVIPGFDPAGFCSEPRALLITAEQIELLDLATGERSVRRPPIGEPPQTARLSHIELDPRRRRLLLWRERSALLVAPVDDDHWAVCELPEGRQVRDWAFACESGRAFVVDDAGVLWLGDVDPEPRPAPRARSSSTVIERELLANPHDPAPFLIYADALNDRGDPRGELIMLHHQRAFDQGHALIQRHAHALIGPLAELTPSSFDLRWERGHVRSAKFTIGHAELDRVLGFLASDSARLIESIELRIRHAKRDDELAAYARLDAYLAAARHLPWLRTLVLGERGQHSPSAELRAAFPRLA